jgi:hypothetical protein
MRLAEALSPAMVSRLTCYRDLVAENPRQKQALRKSGLHQQQNHEVLP